MRATRASLPIQIEGTRNRLPYRLCSPHEYNSILQQLVEERWGMSATVGSLTSPHSFWREVGDAGHGGVVGIPLF